MVGRFFGSAPLHLRMTGRGSCCHPWGATTPTCHPEEGTTPTCHPEEGTTPTCHPEEGARPTKDLQVLNAYGREILRLRSAAPQNDREGILLSSLGVPQHPLVILRRAQHQLVILRRAPGRRRISRSSTRIVGRFFGSAPLHLRMTGRGSCCHPWGCHNTHLSS